MKNTPGYPLEGEGSHTWLPFHRGRVNRSDRFINLVEYIANDRNVNWDFLGNPEIGNPKLLGGSLL